MSISRSNINLQVTRGNNMKNLKDIPAGNKGIGLSKLPTGVRNNMGFKKQGGKVMNKKGGGMAYQLYGGKVSNNGNQFVQSFYDKGN
jgi:hypothetical protein|tara:strand:+ start:719 stop:979 length:261 start_codon:yes stop_codon:yes gene_type:complete